MNERRSPRRPGPARRALRPLAGRNQRRGQSTPPPGRLVRQHGRRSAPCRPHGRVRGGDPSDRGLRKAIGDGQIVIDPFDHACIQPSSVDVRVDRLFRVFRNHTAGIIDVKHDLTDLTELIEIPADGVFMLHPGEFVLGRPRSAPCADDIVARIEGKSSLGRLGLLIHSTAGFVDPGWDGHVTLELANVASLPITLYPGMKIGQLSFMQMTTPADRPYGKARRLEVPGPARPDAEPLLQELPNSSAHGRGKSAAPMPACAEFPRLAGLVAPTA